MFSIPASQTQNNLLFSTNLTGNKKNSLSSSSVVRLTNTHTDTHTTQTLLLTYISVTAYGIDNIMSPLAVDKGGTGEFKNDEEIGAF